MESINWKVRKQLPVIRQTESAECGLACLAMIACWHGLKTDLSTLRERFNIGIAYSALFDHGLASKSDQRFASIRSTGNLTFSTAF